MTLQDFFETISQNPTPAIGYLLFVPVTAGLASLFAKGEGHLSPWKYLYALLIYLSTIPGIFALALNAYLFLFERQPILQANVYTQLLPILSMIITLLLIRRNVDLDLIPGFHRLSGLFLMIAVVFLFMWILDKTRLFVFSYMPFSQVLLIFLVLFILIKVAWSRILKS